ncbi:LacI family DNA-binding transcriptional regulator [Deinococcus aerophilus]|uniref:LacI family transcriptional regulator n=1 Tax=Deinococcus aerophilus TaxID=522488 RepID=A0ABQ2GUY2_9DEIO|nr:LacI family DNA-binding transcriptional regulator [Deinococcus aerophilus]GGM14488.1 LacI family transcriptional regulator [Deinococcus aerophilus]
MSATVTLAHVAREAGVSPSTVSRILNGTANVTPDKRARVEAVIRRLNFAPNVQAQALAAGRSFSVGVLTQDTSPYYGETLAGIERGLEGSPYHPLVVSGHWEAAREQEALDLLMRRRVDALIVLGGVIEDAALQAVAARVPLVAVGRDVSGLSERCVLVDNRAGIRLLVRHLTDLGHREIAFIGGPEVQQDALERRLAFEAALRECGLEPQAGLMRPGDYTEASGERAAEELCRSDLPFTALLCANDQMAFGARLTLYRLGIRVPQDISLTGFDDLFAARYATPPLTTVRQAIAELGQVAAEAVLRLLAGDHPQLPRYVPELIVRDSTGPAPLLSH